MSTAEERLRNPEPGGAIAAAREFGIDLTLLIENLRRTPEERLRLLEEWMSEFEEVRAAIRSGCHEAETGTDRTGRE